MLLLQMSGEFYVDKTTPLRPEHLTRDFAGLFVANKKIYPCRCAKNLLKTGVHTVLVMKVGQNYEVIENVEV